MSAITLKGMTWSHPRGYDPMVACSAIYREDAGVEVVWEKRSLQDFETYPVEELARNYDLIVIDHPHVGQITEERCLLPLDVEGRESEREALAKGSVGASYPSYHWRGRQWAFPIDAAAQVQAFRPDLISTPIESWDDVLAFARKGQVMIPLRPPHSLMTFYTLCGNLGRACATEGPADLIDKETGTRAFEMIREIAALVDPACLEMDPIAVLECMTQADSRIVCAPLIYGYVSYSMAGFRDRVARFADIPIAGTHGHAGSALGGTGIAVSAFTRHAKEAVDFAYWIAGADMQKGRYASSGGQPGHSAAWEDESVNTRTADFYRGTRETLQSSWVRPRHNGYMPFQQAASDRLNEGVLGRHAASDVVNDLNRLFAASFQPTPAS
ncbi:ABC transporter substrate-binding protein [Rhizobium cauense]|uniref:ABC transporter substrate-binding protein n=1 Tax=Rhizobium cauense TaxID=1166683 RepID=UPI0030B911A0